MVVMISPAVLMLSGSGMLDATWADEFTTCVNGRPDPAKWGYEVGFVRPGNGELQRYTEGENVQCQNGELIVTARQSGDDITSSSLSTLGTHLFGYGRIEMRGLVDARPGSWPAFWALGQDWDCDGHPENHPGATCGTVGWPACGEIDIMEYSGKYNTNGANVYFTQNLYPAGSVTRGESAEWFSQYHVYSLDYSADEIVLSVDGEPWNRVAIDNTYARRAFTGQKIALILNLAVGGDLGGDPSGFPYTLRVDYVRYFAAVNNASHAVLV
jgi:beta-glucanase (GH16 family)